MNNLFRMSNLERSFDLRGDSAVRPSARRSTPAARARIAPDDTEGAFGYARPRTYEDLRALLSSATVRLPRQLREVALYVARNPSDFAVGNTVEISRRAGVQPSTLVRFAQALGFPGFSELQDIFKTYVTVNWPDTRGRPDALAEAAAADNPDLRLIAGLAHTATKSLARLPDSVDLAMFEAIAAGMAAAETVYLVGAKRAFPVTTYVALALSQLGIRNGLVDNVGSTGFEQLAFARPQDAVLAVSFSPYNSITPTLAARAFQAGVPVFAITDSDASPLLASAQASVLVDEPDFGGFRSLGGTLALALALVLSIARRREAMRTPQSANRL